ncbi:hypothetical protein RIVM261_013140 [Rivularia sp. IAM M-261]|nr:hypothetical protein RIVM261_013140 [Rivularia sp. IAM M-261]
MPEIITPELNDYLIIQKASGLVGRVKLANLTTVLGSGGNSDNGNGNNDNNNEVDMIVSENAPNNPAMGVIWAEINSNGQIIEEWIRNNNRWESRLKTTCITTNKDFYNASYILESGKKYHLRKLNFILEFNNSISFEDTSFRFERAIIGEWLGTIFTWDAGFNISGYNILSNQQSLDLVTQPSMPEILYFSPSNSNALFNSLKYANFELIYQLIKD